MEYGQKADEFIEQISSNPAVMKWSGRLLFALSVSKKATDIGLNALWKQLQLASKDDQERLLARIAELELQLAELNEAQRQQPSRKKKVTRKVSRKAPSLDV